MCFILISGHFYDDADSVLIQKTIGVLNGPETNAEDQVGTVCYQKWRHRSVSNHL